MRNLFNILVRNSHWLLAVLLVTFSFYLVFTQNSYQRSVYLSSANNVSSWFSSLSGEVSSFFHMKKNNWALLEKNAALETELSALREKMDILAAPDSTGFAVADISVPDSVSSPHFSFIPAEVVNFSFAGPNNFITIGKGAKQGIRPDMGVVSIPGGVVGVVSTVSANRAVIIPVINPKFRLSAKLKNSENYGSISWDGNNIGIAQLCELPKHEQFTKGDTVLTSFSRIFPRNLVIGFVESPGHSDDDNFNTFNIRLASNFYSLQHVLVIDDAYYREQKQLEETLRQ